MSMTVKQAIVPKKTGGNTIVNYGFASTTNNSGSGGNTTINTNNLSVTNLNADTINTSYISASQINASNATITNQLTTNNLQVNNDLHVDGSSYFTNTYVSSSLHGESANAFFNNLTVSNSTNTKDLSVTANAFIHYLQTEGASLGGTTLFDTLIGDSITVDNLEVLKSAHFFELIIDKIKAAGGSILVTPADGFNVESSHTYNEPKYDSSRNSYTLYWQAAEETYQALQSYIGYTLTDVKEGIEDFEPPTTLIHNMWQEGDQAICEEFNAYEGVNYDVSNQYWWRVVKSASTEPILLEKTEGEYAFYNWIEVYANDNTHEFVDEHSTVPKIGDTVAMLGNIHCQDSGVSQNIQRRGSAIYLATYRSIDSGLTPPLFATYQLINNFDLASHRQNKIDANGTTFKGEFISESGDIIDGKSYRIIPATNIITSTTNNNVTTVSPAILQINYLYQDGGTATTSSTVPANYILGWKTYSASAQISSGTINPSQTSQISLPNNLDHLELELYTMDGSTKKVRDALSMKVTSLSNLKDGINGEYTVFIYKDVLKNATDPTIDSSIKYPPTIPSGWTTYMPTSSLENYNYWMSNCTVKYDSNNDLIPASWVAPTRINGENGIGKDGTDYEFIYKNFSANDNPSSWSGRTDNPASWNSSSAVDKNGYSWSNDDYLGPNGTGWDDNPVGITESTPYQYVSVREKKNNTWQSFKEPTLWSKWGENGQDGDGVKYVFTQSNIALNAPTFRGNGYPEGQTSYPDTNNKVWYDNPMNPSVDGNVMCSISTTLTEIDGTKYWTDFGTPAIWAKYVVDGAPGADGITRKLLPMKENVEVKLDYSGTNNMTVKGRLTSDIRYQVIEYNANNELTTVNMANNGLYEIRTYFYAADGNVMTLYYGTGSSASYWYYRQGNQRYWKWNTNNSYLYLNSETETGSNTNNWLVKINANNGGDYYDYYKLLTTNSMSNRTPVVMKNNLMYRKDSNSAWYMVDSIDYNINLSASGVFEHNAYVFRSVFTGSWSDGTTTYNGISWLNQTVNGLNSTVQQHSTSINGLNSQMSEIDQTVDGISTRVTSLSNNLNQNYYTKTEVDQTATNITSTVTAVSNDLHNNYSTTSVTQSRIDQSANNISLYVNKSSNVNYINDSDFTTYNIWTFGASPSTIDPDEYMLYSANEQFIDNNRYTAVEIDMTPSGSQDTMLYTRQDMTNEATIKAGAKIYIEFNYCISYMNGYYAGQTVVGVDICRKTGSLKYINHLAVYNDGIRYASSSGTAQGVNSNDSRAYAQVQPPADTNWHTFRGEFTVQNDVKLTQLYIRLYGWRAAAKPNNQPTLLIIQPKMIVDTASSMQATGIDITDGTITLDADNTVVTGELNVLNHFTSYNPTTKNKVYINSDAGGINIYGPKWSDSEHTSAEQVHIGGISIEDSDIQDDFTSTKSVLTLNTSDLNKGSLIIEPENGITLKNQTNQFDNYNISITPNELVRLQFMQTTDVVSVTNSNTTSSAVNLTAAMNYIDSSGTSGVVRLPVGAAYRNLPIYVINMTNARFTIRANATDEESGVKLNGSAYKSITSRNIAICIFSTSDDMWHVGIMNDSNV